MFVGDFLVVLGGIVEEGVEKILVIGDGGAGGECFGIAVEGEIDVAEAFVDVAEGAIGVGGGVDAGVAGFDGGEEHGFGFVGGGDFVHELAEHETGGGVVFVVADGLDEGGDGAAALAGGVEGGGELEPGRGIFGGEAEEAIEDGYCFGEFGLSALGSRRVLAIGAARWGRLRRWR